MATGEGQFPYLCDRCQNEPADYTMKLYGTVGQIPIFICRFCKQELEKEFGIKEANHDSSHH